MSRPRKIKMRLSQAHHYPHGQVEIGGWIQGKDTYLWVGFNDYMIGIVEGAELRKWATLICKSMPKPKKRTAAQEEKE